MAEHPFVTEVARHLAVLDDRDAQDEADFVLLGGAVERTSAPDPDCWYCWGTGHVCPCHGLGRQTCGCGPRERCECVRGVVTALPNGSSDPPT